ncbi:MAG: AbrB/MazE/SpoVT family DNA-binding domain-containing protein, partial [Clostridiales bacterium]|nr:AbrB/MazE/SpoVT family DNA-binding domain-containing protein [Clostridiales bacterium]
MKATGIVRRIDDLGRVVIPKEIRRTMRIREGDPLEIYTEADGEVIFKKYSPIGELSSFATQYAEVLHKNAALPVIITDNDHVIAAAGISKREVLERRVSGALEELMNERAIHIATQEKEPMQAIEEFDRMPTEFNPIKKAEKFSAAY